VSFGNPLALLALLALVPIAAVWAYSAWRRHRTDASYGGPDALRRGRSRGRAFIRGALLFGAVALAAIAVARPQWGGAEGPLTRRGIDVAIALDISRSMLATDVEPSRAGAAAAGLTDMLTHLRGDRVGLVTFGGTAFARSPLTLDLDAISFLVNRAQIEGALVEPGTNIGAALEESLRLLDVPDRANTQTIVVISDGENLGEGLDSAIDAASAAGVRVYTVAVGTEEGAAVPPRSTPGGLRPSASPRAEESVTSRADRATLTRIADATGGETRDVGGIAGLAVEFARLQQTEFGAESETVPVERFQWFLGAALVMLLLQSVIAEGRRSSRPLRVRRRQTLGATGVLGVAAIAALLAGCGGTAGYQQVREGNEAYEAGRYEEALASYQAAKDLLPEDVIVDYNLGNTLNRLDRLNEATEASRAAARGADSAADTRTYAYAMYAVGNHALASDALEDARDAYIEVLLRDPGDADAKHNLELVLRLLDPSQSQQPPAGGTPPPGGPGQSGQGTPPAGSATPGQGGQSSGSPTPGPGDPGQPATPQPGSTPASGRTPQAGQPSQPGAGQGDESLQELLDQLLAEGVTLEEAITILDRLREQSEAAGLEPRPGAEGGAGDR
jgi:Ca-activated chloride channel family protein